MIIFPKKKFSCSRTFFCHFVYPSYFASEKHWRRYFCSFLSKLSRNTSRSQRSDTKLNEYNYLCCIITTEHPLTNNLLSKPRAKRAGPKGLRAESARAVTGRRNSHRWEGGRLFEPSAGFFYGNSCNFGTKSRKIVSKVGN